MSLTKVETKRLAILSLMLGGCVGLGLLGLTTLLFFLALAVTGYLSLPMLVALVGVGYVLPTCLAATAIFFNIKREMVKELRRAAPTPDETNDQLVDAIIRSKLGEKADSLLKK
jgi:putative superfamily III holin-X